MGFNLAKSDSFGGVLDENSLDQILQGKGDKNVGGEGKILSFDFSVDFLEIVTAKKCTLTSLASNGGRPKNMV